jgi:hypothetical protein
MLCAHRKSRVSLCVEKQTICCSAVSGVAICPLERESPEMVMPMRSSHPLVIFPSWSNAGDSGDESGREGIKQEVLSLMELGADTWASLARQKKVHWRHRSKAVRYGALAAWLQPYMPAHVRTSWMTLALAW